MVSSVQSLMKRSLATGLCWFLGLGLCSAELRLSEVWPEGFQRGSFDALGAVFQVGSELKLLQNSRRCWVNGRVVTLGQAPRYLSDGDWVVSEELLGALNIASRPVKPKLDHQPLENSWAHAEKPVIVIDAGHGGKDPGAIGVGGTMEKDVVLDISKRVAARLKRQGLKVKMTRDHDTFVDLHKRCELSNEWKATVFVSIHCNSHAKREITGHQLYRQSSRVSAKSRADFVRTRYPLPRFTPISKDGKALRFHRHEDLFRWKDKESTLLSAELDRQLAYRRSKVKTQPQKNLCVLRETMAPSILVEVDFVSNPEVEIKMGMESWREKMSEDIVRGLLEYLGRGPQS